MIVVSCGSQKPCEQSPILEVGIVSAIINSKEVGSVCESSLSTHCVVPETMHDPGDCGTL